MLMLHFEGEQAFAEQLKRRGFGDADIPKIRDALFAVCRIDSCVGEMEIQKD